MQFLPFNTLYQLTADASSGRLDAARSMALIPDLIGYWLSGVIEAEETNASTTGLFDPGRRAWDDDLIEVLGLPAFAVRRQPREPGRPLGPVRAAVAADDGAAARASWSRTSGRTTRLRRSWPSRWPTSEPRTSPAGRGGSSASSSTRRSATRRAGSRTSPTSSGVDGRIRFLRNVMGLWLLQESIRTWERGGVTAPLTSLLAAASGAPDGRPAYRPQRPLAAAAGRHAGADLRADRGRGRVAAGRAGALVRCILDSLAAAFAATVRDAVRVSGREVDVVHVVGGGSQNALLCQLTADAVGLPVIAGPVEATAIGNILVQARAHGMITGELEDLRALVRQSSELRRFEPRAAHALRGY